LADTPTTAKYFGWFPGTVSANKDTAESANLKPPMLSMSGDFATASQNFLQKSLKTQSQKIISL
jgi:hypothetical protein